MSKLQVIMKPKHGGELTPLLCDESGEPLPGQIAVEIKTAIDEFATVTVTFVAVEFATEPQARADAIPTPGSKV